MDLGLDGRRAVVTGATQGLGRAIVEALLDEGAAVALCARSAAAVERAVAELASRGSVWGRAIDVGDHAELRRFVADSIAWHGGLDIYVHNASAKSARTLEAWQRSFDVDVMPLVHAMDVAAGALEASGIGSLVTIGTSAVAEHFSSGAGCYTAMKSAITNWTLGQAQVLGARGIRCNVVAPGPTFVAGGDWDRLATERPELVEQVQRLHPMGRLGTAEEVARVVVFVASPAASHLNGANITVDGGFLKRVDW